MWVIRWVPELINLEWKVNLMQEWVYLALWALKMWKHFIPFFLFLFVFVCLFFKSSCPSLLYRFLFDFEQVCFCCSVSVHCEASEWSPWSPCMKKGKTCGFKRGTETRVREITQHPSAKGNLCPPTSETKKCTVQRKKCQKGERGTIILTKCTYLKLHSLMQILLYLLGNSVIAHV